jgi:hypothetical protein
VFQHDGTPYWHFTAAEASFAQAVGKRWREHADTAALPTWPKYARASDENVVLGLDKATGRLGATTETGRRAAQADLWEKIWAAHPQAMHSLAARIVQGVEVLDRKILAV